MTATEPNYSVRPVGRAKIEPVEGLRLPAAFEIREDDPDGFYIEYRAVHDGHRYVITRMDVRQRDGGPAVTGDALRRVTPGRAVREAVRILLSPERVGGVWVDAMQPPVGLAKQGASPEVLAWVAKLHAVATVTGAATTDTIMNKLGISRATAGRWIREARDRGLIGDGD